MEGRDMRAGKLFGAGALLLSLSLFAAACGDDSDSSSSATTGGGAATTGGGAATTGGGGEAAGGAKCDGLAIGFFGALTGDAANLGVNIEQGAELAVEQFNADNPDCQIELKKFDTQGSPDQAPALAKQAIDDSSVVGIVGPAFSGESKVANPLFDEAGLSDHHAVGHRRRHSPSRAGRSSTVPSANDAAQGRASRKYIDTTLKAEEGLRPSTTERVRQGPRRQVERGSSAPRSSAPTPSTRPRPTSRPRSTR